MNSINEIIEQKKDPFYSFAESKIALELTMIGNINYRRQFVLHCGSSSQTL